MSRFRFGTALGFGPDPEERGSGWWIYLLHAAIAIAAGVLLLAVPDRTLLLAALALGIYLIVAGLSGFVRAFTTPGMLAMERAIPAVIGMLAVGAGVLVIVRPEGSVLAIAIAAGVYLIVAGLAAGVAAITGSGSESRALDALRAVAGIGAGVLVIAWPGITLSVLALVLGIYLIVRGAIELVATVALALRSR